MKSWRWPWTSITRLDDANDRLRDAKEEIVHLRALNASLTEQLTRLSRHEAGLPEVPREPRPMQEPMPRDIRDYISGFQTDAIRRAATQTALRKHARGESWAKVKSDMIPKEQAHG